MHTRSQHVQAPLDLTVMANGQRRAKLKAAFSPPPPEPVPAQDDELLDDLFAELDNRSPEVQQEAATVLNDIRANDAASPPTRAESKKGSKQRFKEREVLFRILKAGLTAHRCNVCLVLCTSEGEKDRSDSCCSSRF